MEGVEGDEDDEKDEDKEVADIAGGGIANEAGIVDGLEDKGKGENGSKGPKFGVSIGNDGVPNCPRGSKGERAESERFSMVIPEKEP